MTALGGVKCWGINGAGQLGDGETYQNRPYPDDVQGLTDGVEAISAGHQHTCVLTTSGGVKCWGQDIYGQLGDGAIGPNRPVPEYVQGLKSGVIAIASGYWHTCALTISGGVKCWGNDGGGQLGDGIVEPDRATPTDVQGLTSGVTAISAGSAHTCAVMDSGGAKCWGWDAYGQLGDGVIADPEKNATPRDVVGFP